MIDWPALEPGQHRAPCPVCERGPRDKALSVTVEHDGAGVAFCHRCGGSWSNRATGYRPGRPAAPPVAPPRFERLSDMGRAIWCASRADLSPARGYLDEQRQCAMPPADGDLRYHPSLRHSADYSGPALVGLVTDAVTREPISLHMAWKLRSPAPEPSRKLLAGHRKKGGVIRLWPDESVSTGLAIGEGIETCLSLAHAFTPVWACIDAGNLGAFPVLPGVESLTIAADNDPAGREAAENCARRWHAAGREVRIVMAPDAGADLNDLARAA